MRISVVPEHPGFDEYINLKRSGVQAKIFLNDRDVTQDVIAADDRSGTIIMVLRRSDGRVMLSSLTLNPVTMKVNGKVRIEAPIVHESVNFPDGFGVKRAP